MVTAVATATAHSITLTDRHGHALLICELPRNIRPSELSRLHHQILVHFHEELQAPPPARPQRLSWPEVVRRLEQRMGCVA